MEVKVAKNNLTKISANTYPGRGIVIGVTPDGEWLVQIYWIMGRSVNSRNRIFVNYGEEVRTKAFDESKMSDPSLIIYSPIRCFENYHIVSNGDQTDTVYDFLKSGRTFEDALFTRKFEPDAPNFTPRITGIIEIGGAIEYKLSILKADITERNGGKEEEDRYIINCIREYFHYERAVNGIGHCIHTYESDGEPLLPFCGEPYPVIIPDNIDDAANAYWGLLNKENRVSLAVKYIDRETGKFQIKIINANK